VSGAPLLDVIGCNGSGSHVAFHKIPDGLSAPSSRWGRFFMVFAFCKRVCPIENGAANVWERGSASAGPMQSISIMSSDDSLTLAKPQSRHFR
jgi:hypothetical protein